MNIKKSILIIILIFLFLSLFNIIFLTKESSEIKECKIISTKPVKIKCTGF